MDRETKRRIKTKKYHNSEGKIEFAFKDSTNNQIGESG